MGTCPEVGGDEGAAGIKPPKKILVVHRKPDGGDPVIVVDVAHDEVDVVVRHERPLDAFLTSSFPASSGAWTA